MSDQISPVSESPIDQARMSIIAASIGSCSCNTKSPNVAFHEGHCRYVKLMFALDCLDGHAPTPAEVTDEMLERATAAFYEQQEGPINFTAGMRAALTAALSDTSTDRGGK